MQSPTLAGSPGPAAEAAAVMSVPTEGGSPAIEPSPIPGTTAVASKQAKEAKAAKEGPAASPAVAGMEATTSRAESSPVIAFTPNVAVGNLGAAGTPAKPEDLAPSPVPAFSPTVETTPVAAASPSASVAAATEQTSEPEAPAVAQTGAREEQALATPPPAAAAASATPATALAPAHVRDVSRPSIGESLSRLIPDRQTLLVVGLVLAGLGLLAWVIVPELRRWASSVSVYRRPTPVMGLHLDNGNGAVPAPAEIMKNRFVGGPRQVSLQLKASEPSLRRSVLPVGKPAARPFTPAPVIGTAPAMPDALTEPSGQRTPEPEFDLSALAETPVEAVGPVVEQGVASPEHEHAPNGERSPSDFRPSPEIPSSAEWLSPTSVAPAFENDQDVEIADVAATETPRFELEKEIPEVQSRMLEVEPKTSKVEPVMPELETETPAPGVESRLPQVEVETAEVESRLPDVEVKTPEVESQLPKVETEISEVEGRLPEPETDKVDLETNEPDMQSATLNAEAIAPDLEAEVPQGPSVPEDEPIGQGQPVPYQIPVGAMELPVAEVPEPAPIENASGWTTAVATGARMSEIEALLQTETPAYEPKIVVNEPSFLQSTTTDIMPETTQMQTAPVIRTPATGPTPQPASAMHTAVQLSFSFDIASMQLTPTFKMGALQLRPTSKIVTMRLAPAQHPQPAMNLQVTFELAKIQPAGGGLGTVRLLPSQQQRPQIVGSPSFTVAGLQLVSNFEAAPVQLTPSQQAAVMVTAAFQIATVEFSPSFEIASIVLNSTSKQVAVQLAGTGSIESAPMFDIANLQLGPSGEIGMMQLSLLGQGARRG
jgi:hypothetical protein